MGCCEPSQKSQDFNSLKRSLALCIKEGATQRFQIQLSLLQQKFPNQKIKVDFITFFLKDNPNYELNALASALVLGNLKMFKCLHEKLGADPQIMENMFSNFKISGLHIICSQNHSLFFNYYCEKFFSLPKTKSIFPRHSITGDSNIFVGKFYSPVQIACFMGNISVVKSIQNFCKNSNFLPDELDFCSRHEKTGENCAFLACRGGHYKMMKFLASNQLSDFSILNYYNENILQVLCASFFNRNSWNPDYFYMFQYLCEQVKVDYLYNYQETLLVIKDLKTLEYFQKLLKSHNIEVDLEELEKEVMSRSLNLASHDLDSSKHFDFLHMFPELRTTNFNESLSEGLGNN
jgi:hypothetical protein